MSNINYFRMSEEEEKEYFSNVPERFKEIAQKGTINREFFYAVCQSWRFVSLMFSKANNFDSLDSFVLQAFADGIFTVPFMRELIYTVAKAAASAESVKYSDFIDEETKSGRWFEGVVKNAD